MALRAETQTVQVGLRVKESLRAKLEAAAQERGVSLNAEIVHRLEQSFRVERIKQQRDEAEERLYKIIDAFSRLSHSLPLVPREDRSGIRMGGSGPGIPGGPPWEDDK